MAGGQGQGDAVNQLHCPRGLDIDVDGSIFIADTYNHRIVRWRPHARQGEIIAGGRGPGNQPEQLNEPMTVLIDRMHNCLIISEQGNRRVTRWSLDPQRQDGERREVIISDIRCVGLAIDDEGSLYVSDYERNEVRRYGHGDGRQGVIVAGGHGRGAAPNQLNCPRYIFVDAEHSVYVSEMENHCVTKWMKGAREGVVVAGGQGRGNSLKKLNSPSGIFVDRVGSVLSLIHI